MTKIAIQNEAGGDVQSIQALFPGENLDEYALTGDFSEDLEQYSIDPKRVYTTLLAMQTGLKALYATNPMAFSAWNDTVMSYTDGEPDFIPLPNIVAAVLAENGGDFDPTLDQAEYLELGETYLNDETFGPGYAAVAQHLGWNVNKESKLQESAINDAIVQNLLGVSAADAAEEYGIDMAEHARFVRAIQDGSIVYGGSPRQYVTLKGNVFDGEYDTAKSIEDAAAYLLVGMAENGSSYEIAATAADIPNVDEWDAKHLSSLTGSVSEAEGSLVEGFDYYYDDRTGTDMITFQRGQIHATMGFWNEEEPIQINWMSPDGDDVMDTWNYAAKDIGQAVAKFQELTKDPVPVDMLQKASAKMLSGFKESGTSSKSEGKPAPRSTRAISRTARKEGNQMNNNKRTYRAIKEAKVPSLLRAHRGLKMVREDEMEADEFYVAVAPEGADAATVTFDGDSVFIGPFDSPEAAIAAVGGGDVDVVDAECNPVSADGAADSDDLGDMTGMADGDLPMEARKHNVKKIRENVLKRIHLEATALDVDTTVGGGSEASEGASGEHEDKGAPPVAIQSAQEIGKSHELDSGTTDDVGKPIAALSKPEDGALDSGDDLDLSGAGDGKGSVSISESRFGLKKNQLIAVYERAADGSRGKRVDRGLIEKVTETGVVLAGDEPYDNQSYEFVKIA